LKIRPKPDSIMFAITKKSTELRGEVLKIPKMNYTTLILE